MTFRAGRELQIEDLRGHSRESVAALRDLLAAGGELVPDGKRPGFYEVESDSTVYWIHMAPATGRVMLLATWPVARAGSSEDSDQTASAEEAVCC